MTRTSLRTLLTDRSLDAYDRESIQTILDRLESEDYETDTSHYATRIDTNEETN